MFRWYVRVEVCIVYLSDAAGSDGISRGSRNEWFTRGWTLQELLASARHTKWYNKEWAMLPEPAPEVLSSITSIPRYVLDPSAHTSRCTCLDGYKPGTEMIREKMAWASQRGATRVEDIAYSLIGIFDIDLLIAYDEGGRAFHRLQEAIMERSNDIELFMWTGDASTRNSMIAGSPQCFANALAEYRARLEGEPPRYIDTMRGAMIDLDLHVPQGSRSFSLTNAGLRIDLVLYVLRTAPRLAGISPLPGQFAVNSIQWQRDCETESGAAAQSTALEVELVNFADAAASGRDSSFNFPHALGIVDYEWHDANSGDEYFPSQVTFENPLEYDGVTKRGLYHYAEVKEAILHRRKTRAYFAVLLKSVESTSGARRYRRVSPHEYITVQRPEGGWKKPETVYIV